MQITPPQAAALPNPLGNAMPNAPTAPEKAFEAEAQDLRQITRSPDRQIQTAASQLVATTFLQPLMKMAAESPLNSDLFGTGVANTAFREQLHTVYAERVTDAAQFPLTQRIADLTG